MLEASTWRDAVEALTTKDCIGPDLNEGRGGLVVVKRLGQPVLSHLQKDQTTVVSRDLKKEKERNPGY